MNTIEEMIFQKSASLYIHACTLERVFFSLQYICFYILTANYFPFQLCVL